MDHRDSCDVERETRSRFKGADTTLAQNNVVVTAIGDVIGCGKPLGNSAGKTALVENHLLGLGGYLPDLLQQAEVLKVSRANLKAVDIGVDELAMRRIHDLRQSEKTMLLGRVLHDLERLLAKALEGVRVRARLESAATNPLEPKAGYAFGNFLELLHRLNRAGTSENGDLVGARAEIGNRGDFYCTHTDGVSFITFRMVE